MVVDTTIPVIDRIKPVLESDDNSVYLTDDEYEFFNKYYFKNKKESHFDMGKTNITIDDLMYRIKLDLDILSKCLKPDKYKQFEGIINTNYKRDKIIIDYKKEISDALGIPKEHIKNIRLSGIDGIEEDTDEYDYYNAINKKTKRNNILTEKGTNLTNINYEYNPAVGREDIIEKIAITLATPTQSALLIGMPGVGKTAIVKGIAKCIKDGEFLKGKEIIEISASSFTAGKGLFGKFEDDIEYMIKYIESKNNIILFIDEIQQIYKMGINESNVMNMFKRPISEGKLRIIGSTTKEEYDETIKQDAAFVDRFDVYFIEELEDKYLRRIALDRISFLEEYYDNVMLYNDDQKLKLVNYLIKLTDKRNRRLNQINYNPRIIVQLLDTIFATALIKHPNKPGITREDIIYSIKSNTKLKNTSYALPNIFNENSDEIEKSAEIIDFSEGKSLRLNNINNKN